MEILRGLTVPITDSSILLVAVIKDEVLLLEYFLKHYATIGITHFIFIDNDSTDGSTRYLCDASYNIMLFHTQELFRFNKMKWTNHVLNTYCKDKWTAVVDADELIHVPDLRALSAQLEQERANVCRLYLLDMYPRDAGTIYKQGEPFLKHSNYYDKESAINKGYYDGVRKRVMGVGSMLRKLSFFKYNFGCHSTLELGCHDISQPFEKHRCVRYSRSSQILLHFKFMKPDLRSFFKERLAENQYWNNSAEYKVYAAQEDYNFYDPAYSLCIDVCKPVFSFI